MSSFRLRRCRYRDLLRWTLLRWEGPTNPEPSNPSPKRILQRSGCKLLDWSKRTLSSRLSWTRCWSPTSWRTCCKCSTLSALRIIIRVLSSTVTNFDNLLTLANRPNRTSLKYKIRKIHFLICKVPFVFFLPS